MFKRVLKSYSESKLLYHYLFWIVQTLGFMIDHYGLIEKGGLGKYLFFVLERNGLLIAIVYFNLNYLIPRFYKKKQIVYWCLLGGSIAFVALVHGLYRIYLSSSSNWGPYLILRNLGYQLLANTFSIGRYVVISVLLKVTVDWYDQQKELSKAKIEKLNAELKFMKAQINPHFLFNTFNTLYALAIKKSEKTPDMILRLSQMMEYMIYDSNCEKVYLAKDLENLKSYIDLELERTDKIDFAFQQRGKINGQIIAPLILLPLVENAFKHGLKNGDAASTIKADLIVEEKTISFTIENTKPITPKSPNGGIGLPNLKKRLSYLYPNQHDLIINEDGRRFIASLKICLS
jgi:two-component system, LytTR family, sensor kinase